MASTASRIMKAFRTVFGRVTATSNQPPPAASQAPVTSKNPASENPVASSKPLGVTTFQQPAPVTSIASHIQQNSNQFAATKQPHKVDKLTEAASTTTIASIQNKEQTSTADSTTKEKLQVQPLVINNPPALDSEPLLKDTTANRAAVITNPESHEAEEVIPEEDKSDPTLNTEEKQTLSAPQIKVTINPEPKEVHNQPVKPENSPITGKVGLSSLQTVRPHIPLIRFRKGGLPHQAVERQVIVEEPVPVPALVGLAAMDEMGSSFYQATKLVVQEPTDPALEWWQTPNKYKRRFIDPKECDIINSGGSDQIFQ